MSRIQDILQKAERDGAVHRVRAAEWPAIAMLERPPAGPPVVDPARPILPAPPPAAAPPARAVSGTYVHPRVVTTAAVDSAATEQYRALRTRILHGETGPAVNVVMITSPGSGEGKSLTAANLGVTMAQEFQRHICIVDANLHQPGQHALFGVSVEPGLADVLAGHIPLEDALITLQDYGVTLLPAGRAPMHAAELFGTTSMRRLIDTIRARFDCTVVDAPAAAPLADVGILAPLVDSVVLVVRAGVTPKPAIHDAIASLSATRLLGIVLNDTV